MKPALEAPHSGMETSALVAFERSESVFAWNWHYHPEIELTWIRGGRGTRLVGDHSAAYGPGDLVLLGAGLPHTWFSAESSKRNRAIVVQFRPGLFPEAVLGLPQFVRVADLLGAAGRGIHFSRATAARLGGRLERLLHRRGLPCWLDLARLLDDLARLGGGEILASPGYQHRRSHKLSSRLERVTAFLEKHCREDISLERAAEVAGLTPGSFSRFFHKMTRRTFTAYRNACRIQEACQMLADTDLSITEIAYECGFGNLSNFNRRFREEKRLAPRDYRRQREKPGFPPIL